jgi:Fur family zinc uptake transcriptional regulator
VDQRLSEWARQHGFKSGRTTIELRGLCAACGKPDPS